MVTACVCAEGREVGWELIGGGQESAVRCVSVLQRRIWGLLSESDGSCFTPEKLNLG